MSQNLFVNVNASNISKALVRSLTDVTPVSFPNLVVGDGRSYNLYLVDGLGDYAPFSGSGAYTPFVAIGNCGYPTGGTWTAKFGANTTGALAWNISPADLQTALQALASIGAGNCSVTGSAGKYYTVTFIGAKAAAPQTEIIVDPAGLLPDSGIDVSTIVVGNASPATNAVQLLALSVNPITFADDWTPIANGWTGSLSTRTLAVIQAFVAAGGSVTDTFQVTMADPAGVRTTYLKTPATIQCTIINPESYAGTQKPTLVTQAQLDAAVFGANNFTREALVLTVTGNIDITPTLASRHHTALVSVTGTAGIRTISILSTNSPSPGDTVFVVILPAAIAGLIIQLYNGSPAGTLLSQITTTDSGAPYFEIATWNGSVWGRSFSDGQLLSKRNNLAGLADVVTSRANLKTLFSRIAVVESADFTIIPDDDGTYFPVTTAAGPILATLPLASDVEAGFLVAIQKVDSSTDVVTTAPATVTLSGVGQIVILMSDGTTWIVLITAGASSSVNSFASLTNNSGNTGIAPSAFNHTAIVDVTGTGGTRIIILGVTSLIPGQIIKLRVQLPSTPGITIEIRNADATGTLLYTFDSDSSAQNAFVELVTDGTSWLPLQNVFPVV